MMSRSYDILTKQIVPKRIDDVLIVINECEKPVKTG